MKVRTIFGNNDTDGDVGVEVEVEGVNLPRQIPGWRSEIDGSLRGESLEYVMKSPASLKNLDKALKAFGDSFGQEGVVFNNSYRAGVHVHVNVQKLTGVELATMVSTYYLFENAIVNTCAASRKGNHFCLRAEDAPGVVGYIADAFRNRRPQAFSTDHIRYAAMNLTSLPKYGSVEFRALESTKDVQKIAAFAQRHVAIRDFAQTIQDPLEMVSLAKRMGAYDLAERVFGAAGLPIMRQKDFVRNFEDGLENSEEVAFSNPSWGKKSLDIFSKQENIW